MALKRYDFTFDLRFTVNSDSKYPTNTEILQALVDKVKFLAVNRSQIDGAITLKNMHDSEDDLSEMPF